MKFIKKISLFLTSIGCLSSVFFFLIIVIIITSVFSNGGGAIGNCSAVTPQGLPSSKSQTTQEFIDSLKEGAIQSWVDYGVLPSTFIAQIALETGYGSSQLFRTSNNTGGHKYYTGINYGEGARESDESAPINEGGSKGNGRFYVYFPSVKSSLLYQAQMFSKPPYTSYKILNNKDAQSVAVELQKSPYSTDSGYGQALMNIVETYNLTEVDKVAFQQNANGGGNQITTGDNNLGSNNSGTSLCDDTNSEIGSVGTTSAPTLQVPQEYVGKLTLPAPNNTVYSGNNYPFGECTWGAYNRMAQLGYRIEWFSGLIDGSGGYWWKSAQSKGYNVTKGQPQVAWAVSFPPSVAGSDSTYGHVAVVEYVNSDGSILVSETNVVNAGSGTRSWRVISADTVKQAYFIQGKR